MVLPSIHEIQISNTVGICIGKSRRHLQRGNTASNEAVAFVIHDIDRGHFATWTEVLGARHIVSHRDPCVA